MSDDTCVFKFKYGSNCDPAKPCLHSTGTARIHSLINVSKVHGENLLIELEGKLAQWIYHHKKCVSRYTLKSNLALYTSTEDERRLTKKLRRSLKQFDFRLHCVYCGESCDLQNILLDGERYICVVLLNVNSAVNYISSSFLKYVTHEMTNGQMMSGWESKALDLIFTRPWHAIIKTV